jgi:hypothetical protein
MGCISGRIGRKNSDTSGGHGREVADRSYGRALPSAGGTPTVQQAPVQRRPPLRISVADAAGLLEQRGTLTRGRSDHSARVIERVSELLGRELPQDLADFYRERIERVGEFWAISPIWNDRVGWRTSDTVVNELLNAQAVPIFGDGCGNLFGVDLTPGVEVPAVYFFEHEGPYPFAKPEYAVGSSLGAFLLLLADHDRALDERWPAKWELSIDPDIDKCPRAPPLWLAD